MRAGNERRAPRKRPTCGGETTGWCGFDGLVHRVTGIDRAPSAQVEDRRTACGLEVTPDVHLFEIEDAGITCRFCEQDNQHR